MIILASDHAGYALKKDLIAFFNRSNIVVEDVGTYSDEPTDYPDFAYLANEKVAESSENIGIYICGSGIGMSIAANRHRSIRAALCTSVKFASVARRHNDANVLVLPGRYMKKRKAIAIVKEFLTRKFEMGRHTKRVLKL